MKKKNKFILKRIPILFVGLFLFHSCTIEQELDKLDTGTNEVSFSAGLPVSTLVTTRAVDASLAENRIRQLNLLVFAKDGNLQEVKQVTPTYAATGDDTKKNVTFKTRLTAGNYDFMLVANAKAKVLALAVDGTLSQTAVQSALIIEQPTILTLSDTDTGVIPMWAQLKNVTISNGAADKTVFETNLTRIFAKINVLVKDDIDKSTFELKTVGVYNYNAKGSIVPINENYPLTTTSDNPSLPSDPAKVDNAAIDKFPSDYTYNATSNKCEDQIYLLEAAHVADYGKVNWEKNPCLIIGGIYNNSGTTTYYRIDFIGKNKAGTAGKWLSILRNHIYKVTITGISDKGYDDEEKALKSAPVNITSEVSPWEDGNFENVSIDGVNYLGVTPSNLSFPVAGGDLGIKLRTNLTWTATYYDADGNKIDPQSDSWFTTATSGDAGEDIILTVNAGPNKNEDVRTGYILFTAGRMNVKVNVSQEWKSAIPDLMDVDIDLYEWASTGTSYPTDAENIDDYFGYKLAPFYEIVNGFPTDKTSDLHFNFGHQQTIKYCITIPSEITSWEIKATGIAEDKLTFTRGTNPQTVWVTANVGDVDWSDGGVEIWSTDGAKRVELKAHQCGVISMLKNSFVGTLVNLNNQRYYYGLMKTLNKKIWLDRNLGASSNGVFTNGFNSELDNNAAKGAYFTQDNKDECPPGFRVPKGNKSDPNEEEWGYIYKQAVFANNVTIQDLNSKSVYLVKGWILAIQDLNNWIIPLCGAYGFYRESHGCYWYDSADNTCISFYKNGIAAWDTPGAPHIYSVRCIQDK